MLIWIIMAIGLVVIVGGGFIGRSSQTQRRAQSEHATAHHGKGARRSRGRGRGH